MLQAYVDDYCCLGDREQLQQHFPSKSKSSRIPNALHRRCCIFVAGRAGGAATQLPDSFNRVLSAAGLTLLSIVAAMLVPASLGALRVAVLGEDDTRWHTQSKG